MHTGQAYKLSELVIWTRHSIYLLLLVCTVPVALYQLAGMKWLAVPWDVVFMLGTTVALMAGFKNSQTYNRTTEAQQIWASITAMSRVWGTMSRDCVTESEDGRRLVYRHVAWLTALRYQMRDSKAWENQKTKYNQEYRRHYDVPEKENALERELSKYVPPAEKASILSAQGRATQALVLQSDAIRTMMAAGRIPPAIFIELQKMLRDLQELQAKSERIKDYPFPRQYAIINSIFVKILCLLLPLGMISAMEQLNLYVDGVMQGQMVWLAIPISVLFGWMYAALDQVGESSANPFEGGANDVPISRICAGIEIDLRLMLGEAGVPERTAPASPIVL